jgi:hypothetical protein
MRTVKIDNIVWEVTRVEQGTVWLSEVGNSCNGMVITEQKLNQIENTEEK